MYERLLNSREVAAVLHVSRSYAYQLIRRGDIRSVRMGRAVRVRQRDLENYVHLRAFGVRGRKPAASTPVPLGTEARRSSHD